MSSLCGQHCINNLVQASAYSAPDLADIAHELDEQERQHMLSEGANTPDALRLVLPSIKHDIHNSRLCRPYHISALLYLSVGQLSFDC